MGVTRRLAPADAANGPHRQYRWPPDAISGGLQTYEYSGGSSSISDYAGYGAEVAWDVARSVGSDVADTVSESSLNPVNWF